MGLGKTAEMHALMCARPRPGLTDSPSRLHPLANGSGRSQPMQAECSPSAVTGNVQADQDAERRNSGLHASSSQPTSRESPALLSSRSGVKAEEGRCSNSPEHEGSRHTALVPGNNLVVCPSQLKDQWINEACCFPCCAVLRHAVPGLLCCPVLCCARTIVLCCARAILLCCAALPCCALPG